MTPLSAFDPYRCLQTAAWSLHGARLLRSDPPPVDPDGKAALARAILSREVDARAYLRLCILAGRAKTRNGRRYLQQRALSSTFGVPLGPPGEYGQQWSVVVPQWPAQPR